MIHFDGPTETSFRSVVDPAITPSYASQGVDFLPFRDTTIYPWILRGKDVQIINPARDALVGNNPSPYPASDLDGRAIRFAFNRPERAVGLFFNGPLNGGDGGYLRAYDAAGALLGQTAESAAGGFVGLVADRDIGRVDVVNTFNSDIYFGFYDLQFSPVPEPSSVGIAALGAAAVVCGRRRRGQAPAHRRLR